MRVKSWIKALRENWPIDPESLKISSVIKSKVIKNYWKNTILLPNMYSKEKDSFSPPVCANILEQALHPNPLLAIIIPAFNEEKLLSRTLFSIDQALSNTNKVVRVIVVDNNSSDNTSFIAKTLGAVVVEENKQGIAKARQAGLCAIPDSVSHVLSTDADCIVPKNWVNEYLNVLSDNNLVGAFGLVKYDFDTTPSLRDLISFWVLNQSSRLIRYIKRNTYVNIGSGANSGFKVEAAKDIGGYSVDLPRGEDLDLFKKLGAKGTIRPVKSIVTTSNRRIVGRGFGNHLRRRIYANLHRLVHGYYPSEKFSFRENFR
jgi:glycosyltransferase involved in cell wall biosynthesis